jgi:uncharacterized protein (DUF1697 family)
MTTSYVALLRGINVGAHNRVTMGDLRSLMTGLGYQDVRTHQQSGNIVFRAPTADTVDIEQAIADRLEADLGLPVAVLVRTGAEFLDVAGSNPLVGADGRSAGSRAGDPSRMIVLFLSRAPDPGRLADIDPARYAPEVFAVRPAEIYVYCATGILESPLLKLFSDRRLGCAVTARNWRTVTRVAELLDR